MSCASRADQRSRSPASRRHLIHLLQPDCVNVPLVIALRGANTRLLWITRTSLSSAVAARARCWPRDFSEDPAARVLLVEAGRDTPPDAIPADITDTFPSSSLNPSYFWPGLQAQRSSDTPPQPYVQARVMGGGSSVMGLWALRGMPSDYDAWTAAGATGWGWSDVLPVFRRLENDADRDQSQISDGPYPIRRLPREEWPGLVRAVEDEASRRGLRFVGDMNETPGDGFFAMPLSQDAQGRGSSARCYLTAEVRRRVNLKILTEATVTASASTAPRLWRHSACEGEERGIAAREVIVCAGAIHSPALLLRAGIGPPEELARLGITPRADRAGVGRNLQNHPYLHFGLTLPPPSRLSRELRRFAISGLRLSSGHGGLSRRRPPAVHDRTSERPRLRLRSRHVRCRALFPVFAWAGDADERAKRHPPRVGFTCSRIRAIRRACSRRHGLRRAYCSATALPPRITMPSCCRR